MTYDPTIADPNRRFEIHFHSLSNEGSELAFPCDAAGRVNLDMLCERSRNNYLFARAMVRLAFAVPSVRLA